MTTNEDDGRTLADKIRLAARLREVNRYKKAGTFTIFCQGTGGHREGRCLELITELSAAYWGRDAEDAWGRGTETYELTGKPIFPRSDSKKTNHAFYKENYLKTFLILDGVGFSDMAENPPDNWHQDPAKRGMIDLSLPFAKAPEASPPYSPKNPMTYLSIMGDGYPEEVEKAQKEKKYPTGRNLYKSTKHPMPGDFVFDHPTLAKPMKPNRPELVDPNAPDPELDKLVLKTGEVLYSPQITLKTVVGTGNARKKVYELMAAGAMTRASETDAAPVEALRDPDRPRMGAHRGPVSESDVGTPASQIDADRVAAFVPKDPKNAAQHTVTDRTSCHRWRDQLVMLNVKELKKDIGNWGTIVGEGWDDNVAYAINVLRRLHEEGRFPAVINMIGWSRGGVTCFKLANAIHDYFVKGLDFLYPPRGSIATRDTKRQAQQKVLFPNTLDRRYPDLVMNLFPIDPVPGLFGGAPGDHLGSDRPKEKFPPGITDFVNIPPSVKDVIVPLAADEWRATFAPIDAKQVLYPEGKHPEHKLCFLPFPAIHRTLLRLEPWDPLPENDKPPVRHLLTASPLVVFDLALRFLEQRGTKFQVDYRAARRGHWPGDRPLSLEAIVELYSNMKCLRHAYHQARNAGLGRLLEGGFYGGFRSRRFTGRTFGQLGSANDRRHRSDKRLYENHNNELTVYVRDFKAFVNEHHRAAFEKAYPELYAWLHTDSQVTTQRHVDRISPLGVLLSRLQEHYSNTWNTLVALGARVVQGGYELPPRGAGMQKDDPTAAKLRTERASDRLETMGMLPPAHLWPSIKHGRLIPTG